MRPGVKITLGVFTALLTMSFVVVYDMYIKDKIDSVEVVTVKPGGEILKNEPIEPSQLSVQLREKSSLVDGVITADRLNEIIGMEAANTIVGNSMISFKMLDDENLIPNVEEGEAIRPIVREWIYATPGSLRRKDAIDIYVVEVEEEGASQKSGGSVVVGSEGDSDSNEHVIGPILKDVKVIYAKDQSNKEVIGANKSDKRLDGSSNIAEIEVILNEEDFKVLTDYVVGNNYKLYITYN